MTETALPQSPTNATYVEPSAETILKPGVKLGDLLRRNMTQPYVLQRSNDTRSADWGGPKKSRRSCAFCCQTRRRS